MRCLPMNHFFVTAIKIPENISSQERHIPPFLATETFTQLHSAGTCCSSCPKWQRHTFRTPGRSAYPTFHTLPVNKHQCAAWRIAVASPPIRFGRPMRRLLLQRLNSKGAPVEVEEQGEGRRDSNGRPTLRSSR